MIVCHCSVVSDRDVRAAADAGARTTGEACRATGAGGACGSCVFSVKAVLDSHVARQRACGETLRVVETMSATVPEVDGAAS